MKRLFVALLSSLLAASCSSVRSDVTVTHTLPAAAGKTVAIMPYEPSLASAPDYQANVAKLAAHLQARGYSVVPATGGPMADYVAFFHYGIDNGTTVNLFQSVPQPWVGSIITYGYRGQYRFPARGFYTRSVILEIMDRARFQPNVPQSYVDARVYSGWVTSEGACGSLEPVIDPMLDALFADFPGQSGARTVDLPAETACGPHRFG